MLSLFAGSLFLRSFFSYDQVFLADYVRFRGTDAWYHLRLVENLLGHFPHSITFDPYLHHPAGGPVTVAPLFDLGLAFLAWIVGFGQPSAELIDTLAAWYPAVLGALVTLPVYLAGHLLWGRPAGVVAAALIAFLPGRFLERSLLGSTDHHVAEVMWSSWCLMFLLAALGVTRDTVSPQETASARETDRMFRRRSIGWSVLAGLALAAYLLSWRSGTALPILLLSWILVQVVVDLRADRSSRYLVPAVIPALLSALVAILPWIDGHRVPARQAVVLVATLLASGVAIGAADWIHRWRQQHRLTQHHRRRPSHRKRFLPWVLLTLIALVGIMPWFAMPRQTEELVHLFRRLEPTEWGLTVAEMRPLQADDSAVAALWREFHTAAITAGLGLALVLWQAWRRGRPETILLLVWSLAMLSASLAQRRFTYYLVVVVALLSAGTVCALWSAFWRWQSQRADNQQHRQQQHNQRQYSQQRSLALTLALALLLAPNVSQAMSQARKPSGPDPAWHAALSWLRSNSPDPAEPGFYTALYPRQDPSQATASPITYGVMSWWDRGFWLMRIARRSPIANPQGYGITTAAAFYLAQEESAAQRMLADAGARYVIVDNAMPIRQIGGSEIGIGTVASMATWHQQPVENLVERYEIRAQDGSWRPVFFYYPNYFRSMAPRLQTFSGQAVHQPGSIWVVSFEPHLRADGALVKRVTRMKSFTSHRQATDELAQLPGNHHRLVSTDPTASCVPLEALTRLRRIYPSERDSLEAPPPVQIFEVLGSSVTMNQMPRS